MSKESFEIRCPACSIEIRLWIPKAKIEEWEDGKAMGCVGCSTKLYFWRSPFGSEVITYAEFLSKQNGSSGAGGGANAVPVPNQNRYETKQAPKVGTVTSTEEINDSDEEPQLQTIEDVKETIKTAKVKIYDPFEKERKAKAEEEEKNKHAVDDVSAQLQQMKNKIKDELREEAMREQIKEELKEEIKEEAQKDVPVEEVEPAPVVEEVIEELVEEAESKGPLVLLVDGGKLAKTVASSSLGSIEIELITAKNSTEALDLLNYRNPELLITDLYLKNPSDPDATLDGEDLLKMLSQQGHSIPTIITTGKDILTDIESDPKWLPLNIKGFIQKGDPFWADNLKDKVTEILQVHS